MACFLQLVVPWQMLWRARTLLWRAAPVALATFSRNSSSPTALALAARSTTALLHVKPLRSEECQQPSAPKLSSIILGGTFLGSVLSWDSSAENAPKRKASGGAAKPVAAKRAGPQLSAIEAALHPEKTYTVEKLLASRLAGGKKEYLVRWEGYTEKHDSWEPMENLSNLVNEMAAFDLAKENANQEHVSLHGRSLLEGLGMCTMMCTWIMKG